MDPHVFLLAARSTSRIAARSEREPQRASIRRKKELIMSESPPEGFPLYRLLTGKDNAEFCRRVSEAIALGYQLYGSPAATFNGDHVVVAQTVLWPDQMG
jgi:hypothetical protein